MKKEMEIALVFQLGRTFKSFNQLLQKEFDSVSSELPFEIWIKLFLFSSMEESIQKSLAEYSGIHKTTITRIIDILEEKGFVQRIQDQKDRRQNQIVVTPEGEKEIKKCLPLIDSAEKKIFEGLEKKDLEILNKILEQIRENCRKNCNIEIL